MHYPSVAIVILNYNGKNYLKKFLPAVIASSYPNKKLIVADNGSTDDSVSVLIQDFPHVDRIILPKNYGFAEGYNQALNNIESEYYILLNSDVEVTSKWIEPVISLMQTDSTIAACQPKILDYNERDRFEYAGAAGGWIDYLGYPFNRGRVFDKIEKDFHQYDDVQPIFWSTGAAMFIRSEAFRKVGGLDGFFFAHQEEIDLCWRMQLAGYKILYCPFSIVYHVGGGTLPKGHYNKVFLNFRNNIIMLSKNMPLKEKFWKLPLRVALDALFGFKCLITGDVTSFKAVFFAEVAYIKWLFTKKTKQGQITKPLKQLCGVSSKSIVWAYFVQKKTRFTEIVKNRHT